MSEVVGGKLLAGFYSTWGILAAAGWAGAAVLAFGGSRRSFWVRGRWDPLERLALWAAAVLILIASHAFVTALSTYASTLSRRSTGALVVAYGGVLAAYLGWPMLFLLGSGPGGVGVLAATNPFVLLRGLIQPLLGRGEASPYLIFLFFLPLHAGGAAILWILACSSAENRLTRDP